MAQPAKVPFVLRDSASTGHRAGLKPSGRCQDGSSVSVANVEVSPSRGVSADDNRRALVQKSATRWSSRTENASESVNRLVTVTAGVPVPLGPAGMRPYRDQAGTRYALPGKSHLPLTRHETLERPGVSASHLDVSAVWAPDQPRRRAAARPGGTAAERLLLARPDSESGRRPPAPACPAPPWGRRRRLTVASVSARRV
jgi:hypothetical protein